MRRMCSSVMMSQLPVVKGQVLFIVVSGQCLAVHRGTLTPRHSHVRSFPHLNHNKQ